MIFAYLGRQGSGKTYLQSIMALWQAHSFNKPIISNYDLKYSKPVTEFSSFQQIKSTVLSLDEMQWFVDSRESKKNVDMTHYITQFRKLDIDFHYNTQRLNQIDKRLRENTDIIFLPNYYKHLNKLVFDIFDAQAEKLLNTMVIDEVDHYFGLYKRNHIVSAKTLFNVQ